VLQQQFSSSLRDRSAETAARTARDRARLSDLPSDHPLRQKTSHDLLVARYFRTGEGTRVSAETARTDDVFRRLPLSAIVRCWEQTNNIPAGHRWSLSLSLVVLDPPAPGGVDADTYAAAAAGELPAAQHVQFVNQLREASFHVAPPAARQRQASADAEEVEREEALRELLDGLEESPESRRYNALLISGSPAAAAAEDYLRTGTLLELPDSDGEEQPQPQQQQQQQSSAPASSGSIFIAETPAPPSGSQLTPPSFAQPEPGALPSPEGSPTL
jgi:hypothetical protein